MKITFDMDIAFISEAYKENVRDLLVIAHNLKFADTQYFADVVKEQNEWRDHCVARLKAIDAFYLTDGILPEYDVTDWVKDVLNLSHYLGVLTRIDTYSCLLHCTPGWGDWDNAFRELSRVLGKATGKKGWKLTRAMKGDQGMLLTLASTKESPLNTDLDERREP